MNYGKIISTEPDRLGQMVNIRYVEEITNTPVLSFFLRNMAQLIDRGHSTQAIPSTAKLKAVYAEMDGQVVGHIVFDILDGHIPRTSWIVLSAIDDAYQRRGLYTILHRHFEAWSLKLNCPKIASFVHVDNLVRQASCSQVGMKPVYYRMEKELG